MITTEYPFFTVYTDKQIYEHSTAEQYLTTYFTCRNHRSFSAAMVAAGRCAAVGSSAINVAYRLTVDMCDSTSAKPPTLATNNEHHHQKQQGNSSIHGNLYFSPEIEFITCKYSYLFI